MPKSLTACLCLLAGTIAWCALEATRAWVALADRAPATAAAALHEEGELTRQVLERQAGRYEIHLAGLRADLVGQSAAWRDVAQQEAILSRLAAVRQAEGYRVTLESLGREAIVLGASEARLTRVSAVALMDEYRRVPGIVGARLDPWTNCPGNGACWQAQATALLGAARVTAGRTSMAMRTVETSLPSIAGNVDSITGNVARLTRPATVWERVLRIAAPAAGGAILGAVK